MMPRKIFIGTSGWNYKHWLGPFYPEKFRAADMLRFYSEHFDSVEINATHYHLPRLSSFDSWRATTPGEFVFAVKASRFITHMKKLKAPRTSTEKFFAGVERLEDKLGPILFQLPPHWHLNYERLESFLSALPTDFRYTFEFRDHSWHTREVYDLLKKHNVALCFYHQMGYDSPAEVTADFVYVRLHGTESKYAGSYPRSVLKKWAHRIGCWRKASKRVYFYFNNDPEGHAVKNALSLKKLVAEVS
jgi:uncharacterized protein YecE (DUF72 family)